MVVCSLYLTAHRGSLEAHPRNIWLTLQVMTSLSAALASFLAGLRKGAVLFPSLKRVVRLPFSTGPVARISGSFSFEEGGRMALRDLDLSGGHDMEEEVERNRGWVRTFSVWLSLRLLEFVQVLHQRPWRKDSPGLSGCPSFSARPHQDEGDLWTLGTSCVNSAFWGTALTLFLVLLQRGTQLLQLLLLATWGDQAMLGHCDHGSFARNLAIAVLLNALFFTLSEWAASRLARRQRTAPDVDSLVVSSWLACVRTIVWLPVYVCIYFFASIYLRAAVALASRGEESFQELQEVMSKSLEPDPVCLRGNHLQNHFGHRFDLLLRTMTRSRNALPACIKSWLHFRVTFCLSFAAAACALEVLLCAERSHVGVGSLGLVISLLLALAGDLEVSCDSAVQGCVALKTASRISRKGEALLVLDSPETAEEAPEIQEEPFFFGKDGLDVEALLKASGRSGLGGVGVPGEVEVALPSETYAKIERLSKSFPLVTQEWCRKPDPALWDGTWHENLDPGRRWPEERVWAALRGVGLAPLLEALRRPRGAALSDYRAQMRSVVAALRRSAPLRHRLCCGEVDAARLLDEPELLLTEQQRAQQATLRKAQRGSWRRVGVSELD
eukprot:g2832.t1